MSVLIVGGGVMGCATALELATRGVRGVIVLERTVPGAEASSAAAGMLAAQIEAGDDVDERARFVAARDAYASWAARLREASGIGIGYRRGGALVIARTSADASRAQSNVEHHTGAGLRAEFLTAERARALEPELSPNIAGATYFPDEAQVDPPQLLAALVVAATRAGVEFRSETNVSSLLIARDRCTGVALGTGDETDADAVVVAAGSWSSQLVGLPSATPHVGPVRGQIVQLDERPTRTSLILLENHTYVVPRGDGRVICGSTMEDVGHRRAVTAAGIHGILSGALGLVPNLANAEIARTWCNFRPSIDAGKGRALVGRSSVAGLFFATGHHRNGILLANATAVAVADAMLKP